MKNSASCSWVGHAKHWTVGTLSQVISYKNQLWTVRVCCKTLGLLFPYVHRRFYNHSMTIWETTLAVYSKIIKAVIGKSYFGGEAMALVTTTNTSCFVLFCFFSSTT